MVCDVNDADDFDSLLRVYLSQLGPNDQALYIQNDINQVIIFNVHDSVETILSSV